MMACEQIGEQSSTRIRRSRNGSSRSNQAKIEVDDSGRAFVEPCVGDWQVVGRGVQYLR